MDSRQITRTGALSNQMVRSTQQESKFLMLSKEIRTLTRSMKKLGKTEKPGNL